MWLPQPFYKLPLSVDAERLREEISQFDEAEWRAHPSGFDGNSALILVSTNGEDNDDLHGPMQATPRLEKMPYTRHIMAQLNTVVGRSRLMRLAPGAKVNRHTDINYYWRHHIRLHIPIVTDENVIFQSGDETAHMAAGEVWTLDNWRQHAVRNDSKTTRIHLVIDTVGSAALWNLIEHPPHARTLAFNQGQPAPIPMETFPGLEVLPPADINADLQHLQQDLNKASDASPQKIQAYQQFGQDFTRDWHSLWTMHGPNEGGLPAYRARLQQALAAIDSLPLITAPSNELDARRILQSLLGAAINPGAQANARAQRKPPQAAATVKFKQPVFILAAPRSGSTLLFETLAQNRALWTVGDESHRHFESIARLRPDAGGWQSNRLEGDVLTPAIARQLASNFVQDLRNSDQQHLLSISDNERPTSLRFLEKTPKNALRVPFLRQLFPDAKFIYLFRNPRDNISSLLDSWRSGRYITYRDLPAWEGNPWSHLLVPGWQGLIKKPLIEIVTQQWMRTNQQVLQDLQGLADTQWTAVSYEAFMADTSTELERLCDFIDAPFGPNMQQVASQALAPSKYTLSEPDSEKWRRNAEELEGVSRHTDKLYAVMESLLSP